MEFLLLQKDSMGAIFFFPPPTRGLLLECYQGDKGCIICKALVPLYQFLHLVCSCQSFAPAWLHSRHFTKARNHQFLRIFSSNQFSSQSACHVSEQQTFFQLDYRLSGYGWTFFFCTPIPQESSLKSWHRPGSFIRLALCPKGGGHLIALMVNDKAFWSHPESNTAG